MQILFVIDVCNSGPSDLANQQRPMCSHFITSALQSNSVSPILQLLVLHTVRSMKGIGSSLVKGAASSEVDTVVVENLSPPL